MEVEISPLRSLDDFLLESARFQVPNFKDFEKWGNRVVNNLLYYQTNYFLLSIVIFTVVGIIHPTKMFCGTVAMTVAFGLFYYVTNATRSATRFKKEHPIISVFLVLGGGYFVVYMLGSVVVFLFGILLPLVVSFIHASMRLRNVKNKITYAYHKIYNQLADELQKMSMITTGTVMTNRKGLPVEIKKGAGKKMKKGDVLAFRKGDQLALSWKDKRSLIYIQTIALKYFTQEETTRGSGRRGRSISLLIKEDTKYKEI
ncbi:hypothetical protein C0J52_09606 [Blattella germanica]|nr:hypothetical protein C0J52_09606 [Blattella germanica]